MVALRGKKQIKLTRRQPILMSSYEFCSCVMCDVNYAMLDSDRLWWHAGM